MSKNKKPEKETISYYDWESAVEYLKWSESKRTKVWNKIIEHSSHQDWNGKIFTISDWELKHNNGEYSYINPKWYNDVIKELMESFGEEDAECLTPGVKTANFMCTW